MIRAAGLTMAYREHVALMDVSFVVPVGSLTAVVGANGAGKSTLLRCLAGLARHGGTATVRRPVGYLPQGVELPPTARTGEVRALFALLGGRPDTGSADRYAPPINTLSGGLRQRAALSALYALAPQTLLLDEPTANLDDDARAELFATLHGLASTGVTIMLTSPAPQAGALGREVDRVLTLAGGRLVDPS